MCMKNLAAPGCNISDRQALVEVYEKYSSELHRYAYRLLGDSDVAEDCVAETFSRLLLAVHHGNGPNENVRAWLYRVAHNWVTDHYRRQPLPNLSLDGDWQADPDGNPYQTVDKELERERLRNALMSLPPDQRLVIELRFLEEWSHEEVSTALGKTPEACRALQHRALAALRRLLIEVEE